MSPEDMLSHWGKGGGWAWCGGAPGTQWVESRDAAEEPTMVLTTTAPTTENDLAPNVNQVKIAKPGRGYQKHV